MYLHLRVTETLLKKVYMFPSSILVTVNDGGFQHFFAKISMIQMITMRERGKDIINKVEIQNK